ncbi:MAG: hypothetical protein OXC91_01040, partial [Rhodobacteraceae bacterium]|nr:hypothetical protein [Paracoccaceae bacterium]
MRKFSVRKSDFSIEGFFAEPAFDLLSANSDVLSAVSPSLADFCPIRGADIRIDQDASPLGNANVVFELRALNGFARISIDRAQIVLFSPHRLNQDLISRLAASFLEAVKDAASAKSYGHYIADLTLHAALDDITPEDHTREFVLPSGNNLESAVGNSVNYYFGKP